jgi:apolipoprotein N-acyltransferase
LNNKSFLFLFFKKDHAFLRSFLSGKRALAAGFALGILAAGALPPLSLAPLALLSLPLLFLLIGRAASWRGAAARGFAFGMGYHLAGLYWVTNAVLVMAAEFWWAVPITVPLLAAVMAVFIALPCAAARLARPGWRRVAVLAGTWTLGDLARQFVLSGFPWNLLGSVWEMPGELGLVFMQPAAWVTAHGLTLATVALGCSLALGWRGRLAACGALAAWGIAGFAQLRIAPAGPMPAGLMAVLVQGNVSEQDHRDHGADPAWAEHVFDKYLALTRAGVRQAAGKPMLVIWPETASPYQLDRDRAARLAVADAAAPALITLAGTERFAPPPPAQAGMTGGMTAHNSLVAVAPDGSVAGIYDKSHLVPFGEYFPSYAHFMLGEQGFTPGPGIRTLHLRGLPSAGPLICYEAIFPGQVVQAGDRPAMLVNITNDAWFGDSAGPRQHLAAARMRSVEEGLPMLRAANTGISAIIDAHGRLDSTLGLGATGVLVGGVPGSLPPTLAARLGLIAPSLLAVMATLSGCRIRPPKPGKCSKNENMILKSENFIDYL